MMKDLCQTATDTLVELCQEYPNLLVLDSITHSEFQKNSFHQKLPKQYFHFPTAVLNVLGIATGLSTQGYISVVNSLASLLILHGGEAIQNLIGLNHLNVTLLSNYGGEDIAQQGITSHVRSDLALMCAIPDIWVACSSDDVSMQQLVKTAILHDGPVYLRTSKTAIPTYYAPDTKFCYGGSHLLKEGYDVSIFTMGAMTFTALEAAISLEKIGISARVIDSYSVQPLDTEVLLECAVQTGAFVCVEEHSVEGGLGSRIARIISKHYPIPIEFVGIQEFVSPSVKYSEFLQKVGLTKENIIHTVKKVIERKKDKK